MKKRKDRAITEVLIKWKGAPEEENNRKILWKLRQLYPHLKNKVL